MQQSMGQYLQICKDYDRIALVIQYLEENFQKQPSLSDVAAGIGLSEYHFQRLFKRWAGISPKRFIQFLTKEHAKRMLEESGSLLEAAYSSGLSSLGRLHDLFVVTEAVTPGEYKERGQGVMILYDILPSPFGECLVATTERGICYLAFIDKQDHSFAIQEIRARWPYASIEHHENHNLALIDLLFFNQTGESKNRLALHLHGTNFQLKVWEGLLSIPQGNVVAYEDLARSIGKPNSARAVGNAVGQNPIPLLIPCHRVIRKAGVFGNYHYGSIRKKAILGWEAAHINQEVIS